MLCVSTFWNHLCKQAYKSTNDNVGQTVQNYFLNVFLSCHDVMWSNFLIWCFVMTNGEQPDSAKNQPKV